MRAAWYHHAAGGQFAWPAVTDIWYWSIFTTQFTPVAMPVLYYSLLLHEELVDSVVSIILNVSSLNGGSPSMSY